MPRINADTIEEHKELTRSLILEAAEAVFGRCEYSDANLSEIADLAHVGRSTLYDYFPSKEALLVGLISARAPEPLTAVVGGLPTNVSCSRRLERLMAGVIGLVASEPILTWLIFRVGRKLPKEHQDEMWASLDVVTTEIHDLCARGIEAGEFAGDDPDALSRICSDLLMGGIEEAARRGMGEPESAAYVIEHWVPFVVRGVAAPSSATGGGPSA